MHLVVFDLGGLNGGTKVHGDVAFDLFADEPAGGWAEMTFDGADAELCRERVKEQREVGAEFGLPADAETGAGMLEAFEEWARLATG